MAATSRPHSRVGATGGVGEQHETEALQREIEALRPAAGAEDTWLSPFMKNRTVSLECLDCGAGEAKRAADRINLILNDKKIQVKGGLPRAARGQPATGQAHGVMPCERQACSAQRSIRVAGVQPRI